MLHERWKGARGRMAPEWRGGFEGDKRRGVVAGPSRFRA